MVTSFFRRHPWLKKSRGWKDLPRRWGKSSLSLEALEDRITPSLLGVFELDGNVTTGVLGTTGSTTTSHDWDQVFANTSGALAASFVTDAVNSKTDNIFTGGGSKDVNDLDQWEWGPGSVQPQSDIQSAYAAAYIADNELNVFIGQDRLDTNGAGEVGFWFFQQDIDLNVPLKENDNGTFSGRHTVGDVLILVKFEKDVGTVEVYQWDPTADDNLRLLVSMENAYGISNGSPIEKAAWRSGIPINGFFEAGINLTRILGQTDACLSFTSFLAESRSGSSLNAALQDFVLGSIRFSTCPDIEIVKKVHGDDANAAPGPSVLAGNKVTFTYEVTNTGARPLSDVQVVDDNGTPGDKADDFSPTYVSGDDDGDKLLDGGEVWTYKATRTATAGQHASQATVRGNEKGTELKKFTDTDLGHYFGAAPSLSVLKEVSVDGGLTWKDADTETGPHLLSGTDPQFRYTVKNTGNVALNVSLTDSDFAGLSQPGVLQANDGAEGGPDEFVYVHTGATWAAGQHGNTATVEASYTDSADNSTTVGDSDDAHYFGVAPPPHQGGRPPVRDPPAAPDDGLTPTEDPTLVGAALAVPDDPVPFGPAVPPGTLGPAGPSAPESFAGGQVAPGAFLSGGGEEFVLPEAEASVTPAGGNWDTVLPMQPAYGVSPGVAFVPEAEAFSLLGERLAAAGGGSWPEGTGENLSALLLQHAEGKALRLASSLADADDSVTRVEAITGPEAVATATLDAQPLPAPSPAGAEGPAPEPGHKEEAAPGLPAWAWRAGMGGLAAALSALAALAARRWRRERRRPPAPPRPGAVGVRGPACVSFREVNHVRPQ